MAIDFNTRRLQEYINGIDKELNEFRLATAERFDNHARLLKGFAELTHEMTNIIEQLSDRVSGLEGQDDELAETDEPDSAPYLIGNYDSTIEACRALTDILVDTYSEDVTFVARLEETEQTGFYRAYVTLTD